MKRINLALQGGGAHGAFTWGVLSRILAEEDIEIAAISGTSAGALNAAALKSGWVAGGRQGAIDNLDWLWGQVGAVTDPYFSAWMSTLGPTAQHWAKSLHYSPLYTAVDFTSRLMSPYDFGMAGKNPLASIVDQFHYDKVCGDAGPELHICATNVRSGKIRVFAGDEISSDVILASACLPSLFKAVEFIDPKTGESEAFWDGGYTGNPALFPLFEKHLPDDILIVNINPLYRDALPTDVQSIQNRINEISFNSSLLRELRAIDFVKRLITDGAVPAGAMKNVLVHMIADDALMNDLNVATKTIATPVVLARLRAAGEEAADAFLAAHKKDLNQQSTVDLTDMFS
ncbi:patatin-like phospholipase family protein [Loktanella sp. D2R18]|uniref:patatin-like phospholipase family protein n=1 Tax=Rhodobacterales TaxID=204455 RepID=UPI000DE8B9DB|nr:MULTISPECIES: patatin-like phospholipase family protein [Rhodobacterales]MDO6589476.1 patatin-like phospholipase family protein [Yoonia sp. 1_MG-2023]RBW44460.1 patatin-like phospholipase family protein [Loktanella sp. D2R18]